MVTPFLGEIRIMSFDFAPNGWAMCNGSLLPINQNQALFALLGTTYGGDGQTNFALPDLRGRIPMHFGSGFNQGERAGEQGHTLSISEIPTHTHVVVGTSTEATTAIPTGNVFANSPLQFWAAPNPLQPLLPSTITTAGGSQAHNNMSPYLVLTFCIALQGVFPSQN
jgi:microcystin-dependent protein